MLGQEIIKAYHPCMVDWFGGDAAEVAHGWARSGLLPLTGHPDGSPVLPPGGAPTLAARLGEYIGVAGIDTARLPAERAAFTRRRRAGRISVGGSCRLLPTRDGWAAVSLARPDDPVLWGVLIGEAVDSVADRAALPERLATWIAAHSGDELNERVELLGLAGGSVEPDGRRLPPIPRRPPRSVQGLLVVDFSALWAGPLCAHLLGLAGATVVKVETPTRPDGARRGAPDFYDLLHGGHASVVLDPTLADERAALQALVRRADIVIEASRPRALIGFGLDAREEVDRGCTWISITAFGRDALRVGFGDDVAAARGLLGEDTDGLPVFCGDAIADPLTGLLGAALALSEPEEGRGQMWDIAMADVASAALALPSVSGAVVRPTGDRRWVLDTGLDTTFLVEAPTLRRPDRHASSSGADTSAVLSALGIRLPRRTSRRSGPRDEL